MAAIEGSLRVGLLNIRSMRNKMISVVEILNEFGFDILCLTETWLLESDFCIVKAALPKTHSVLHIPRSSPTHVVGGGVAVVYSLSLSNIRCVPLDQPVSSFECMEVTINTHCQIIRLAIIYRPGHPGTDRLFMEEFGTFLECFSAKSGKLIICGDFNYWVDTPGMKPYSSEFLELVDMYSFSNLVVDPTHVSGHTLDLVLSESESNLVNNVEVFPIDRSVSDHDIISFGVNVPKPLSYTKKITFRKYCNFNQETISRDIELSLNTIDIASSTVDQLVHTYNAFFRFIQDRDCPEIDKEIRIKDDAPWYDSSVVGLRKRRRRAERLWRRHRTESSRLDYVAARRAATVKVTQRKIEYYTDRIDSCRGDQKRLFSTLNSLTGQRSAQVLPSSVPAADLASRFSAFFADKINRIRNEFDNNPVLGEYSVVPSRPLAIDSVFTHFQPINSLNALTYTRELNKTFCSLDPINVSKISTAYETASPFIAAVVNRVFEENCFPNSEKHAIIRPLLKKAGLDCDNLVNYRPVSNLSFLSKIVERAILDQLLPFLERNSVIPQCQSAYRKLHSTETGLSMIYNDLVKNTCSGRCSLLVLLDLSAAFDTVDHQLLLRDLSSFGVQGDALLLLHSYIADRSQCVVIGGSMSEPSSLKFGVPQGSVLGPVLFIIYVSSLSSLLDAHGVKYHFYADDSQLYIEINNIDEVKNKLSSLLSDLKMWMTRRKLKLNDNKTEIMVINGNLRNSVRDDFGCLEFGNSQLQPLESVRNLGVVFDKNLSFKNHINNVVKGCHLYIRNLYAIKKFLSRESLLTLIHSFVISRIDYCNSLFVGLPNVTLKKLQSVLNRCARLIFSLPPRTPTTYYLIDLHWLPIKARIEFKICLLTFRVLRFGEPKYMLDLLFPTHNESNVNLRSGDDPYRLYEPRAIGERAFAARSFSYVAPRLFNRLPVSLKLLNCVDAFKKQLKSHLFLRAYDTRERRVNDDYKL